MSRVLGRVLEAIAPPRVKGYAKYDFHVSYTDWFDRLSYPCVNYYNGEQVREWYERNGLTDLKISPLDPSPGVDLVLSQWSR